MSVSSVISNHIARVFEANHALSDHLENAQTIKSGISSIDAIAGTRFYAPLEQTLKEFTHPAIPSLKILEQIGTMHDTLIFISMPVLLRNSFKAYLKQVGKGLKDYTHENIRHFNLASGLYSFGLCAYYLSKSFTLATTLLPQIRFNQRLLSRFARPIANMNFTASACYLPFIASHFYAIKQTSRWMKTNHNNLTQSAFSHYIDDAVMNECFGMKGEKLQRHRILSQTKGVGLNKAVKNQINFYNRIKMVKMACAVSTFATSTILSGPGAAAIAMGTVLLQLGSDFWLERRITQFKTALNVQDESKTLPKVTSLASLIATPFVMIPETNVIAGVTILTALGIDVLTSFNSSRKRYKRGPLHAPSRIRPSRR